MGTGELLGKPNKLHGSDLRWTSISPGEVEYFLPLHATETGISSGSYEPVLAPRRHTQDININFPFP